MKFGIMFANTGYGVTPDGARSVGTIADDLGYESIWTVEHVVVPSEYESTYPYSPSGRMPGTEDAPIPDPLIWLTYVAAVTTRVRLATGILILPQRNPVILAKELATLDVLSNGRLTLGVGIGWLREEFEAIGVPFEERAAITDEHIEALRVLWQEPEPTHKGTYSSFERAKMYPKPVQPAGPPIVVGGHTKAAARRAGRIGDGFFPGKGSIDDLIALFDVARDAAREAGRDPEALEITCGAPPDVDYIKRLQDNGVSRIVVPGFGMSDEQYRQLLGGFADNVMAKF
ncbi:MAG TPA: LLM class F420-dependent oxidoreductase [Acidimicrobiales bacterium]|jgi:probable F420-dependent oxidoreductase|nr:LLM class F420-dependent oxidoreductase [Acidimicrobiales bacterium]